jgi:uncharacterized protein YdaU (DUF1376 family)
MKQKKIQYVSLEAGAFLSDLVFTVMNAEERGVYCSLIFYLYENNGVLPHNTAFLKHLCNCENFEKTWEFVKQKFNIEKGKITHKRVVSEINRAKQFAQIQSQKGVKGNEVRWKNYRTGIAGQSPENRQVTKSEVKRSEVSEGINTNTNGSQEQSFLSTLRFDSLEAGTLEILKFRIYEILSGIFKGKTVSDSTSLRNLMRWVKEQIDANKFEPEIFKRIVNMAVESKNGKSRNPLAVFFAQVKRELGYKKDD